MTSYIARRKFLATLGGAVAVWPLAARAQQAERMRRIGVLRIDHADGRPLALVANYAIHGTVLGQANLQISGDAPGVVSNYVEGKTGALPLFVNGETLAG